MIEQCSVSDPTDRVAALGTNAKHGLAPVGVTIGYVKTRSHKMGEFRNDKRLGHKQTLIPQTRDTENDTL
jgi:hypothetical protein